MTAIFINIFYLPAGWSAQCKTVRTDPKPANNMFMFFPAVNLFYRLQMGLFTQLCH